MARSALIFGFLISVTPATIEQTSASVAGDISPAGPCQPWAVRAVYYRDSMSITHLLEDVTGLARVTQLTDGAGSEAEMVTPPIGWKPVGATDEELAAYGFSPRPTDPIQLSHWNDAFGAYRAEVTPFICTDHTVISWKPSHNWTGAVADGHSDYSKLTGYTRVQQYIANCRSASAVSVWAGLGGDDDEPMLQAGIVTPQNGTLNEMWPFFEGVQRGNHPLPPNYYFGTPPPAGFIGPPAHPITFVTEPGDSIYVHVQYNGNASPPNAQFEVYDDGPSGTGGVHASVTVTTLDGSNVSDLYSGKTAEFIVERPIFGEGPNKGKPYEFREFPYADYHWNLAERYQAGGPATDIGTPPMFTSNTTVDGSLDTPYIANVANPPGYSTPNSFYVHWDRCPDPPIGPPLPPTDPVFQLIP
jgi:hypothetical protein